MRKGAMLTIFFFVLSMLSFCNREADHGFVSVILPADRLLSVQVQPSTLILTPGPPRKNFRVKACFYGNDTAGATLSVVVKDEEGNIPWWFFPSYINLSGVCGARTFKMPLNVGDVKSGLYSVEVSPVSFPGGTYTAKADLVIIAPEKEGRNEAPSAYFTYTPPDVYVDTEVYFDASASSDPDGKIVGYSWRVDGNWVGEGRVFSWRFNSSGIHQVTLRVVDDRGAEAYYSENIDVLQQ